MEISFNDKQVFITGASRGIGRKIREMFEKNGAVVTAPGRDRMDLLSKESIRDYIRCEGCPAPDIFVHCAGVNRLAGIEEVTDEILDEVFRVNYYAPVELLSQFVSGMKEKGGGHIILISSLYAVVSKERRIAYSSSKNALTGLAKSLALELAPYNIMVNMVAPGYVMTDMTRRNLDAEEQRHIRENIPTGRFQTEEEIASMVLYLCSDWNRSITGQLVAVDGGFLCR